MFDIFVYQWPIYFYLYIYTLVYVYDVYLDWNSSVTVIMAADHLFGRYMSDLFLLLPAILIVKFFDMLSSHVIDHRRFGVRCFCPLDEIWIA